MNQNHYESASFSHPNMAQSSVTRNNSTFNQNNQAMYYSQNPPNNLQRSAYTFAQSNSIQNPPLQNKRPYEL